MLLDIVILAVVFGLLLVAYVFGEIQLYKQGQDVHSWVAKFVKFFKK